MLRASARCAALGAAAHAAAPPPARPERAPLPPAAPAAPPSPLRAHGLLAGVKAPERAAFYAPLLPDLRAAGALLTTRGLLWAAAAQDAAVRGEGDPAAYIASVERAAEGLCWPRGAR